MKSSESVKQEILLTESKAFLKSMEISLPWIWYLFVKSKISPIDPTASQIVLFLT